MGRCQSPFLTCKDTIDEDQYVISKMKWPNNGKNRLDGHLCTHTIARRLVLWKVHTSISFSKTGYYHTCGISPILLHTFAKCLITLSFSTSFESWKSYRIWIQLITAILLHPHKTLLSPLPDLGRSLFGKFVPYTNHAFLIDTNPATSSRGTKTRARIDEWDMSAAHACNCLHDEHKCSVNKWGRWDDAKQIVTKLNCSKDDVAASKKPSKPIYIFTLLAHLTYYLQTFRHPILTSDTSSPHPWWYIKYSWCLFKVTTIWYPPLNY